MPRCGPSEETFAASAKARAIRINGVRTKLPIARNARTVAQWADEWLDEKRREGKKSVPEMERIVRLYQQLTDIMSKLDEIGDHFDMETAFLLREHVLPGWPNGKRPAQGDGSEKPE